jgi:hypothetical protein
VPGPTTSTSAPPAGSTSSPASSPPAQVHYALGAKDNVVHETSLDYHDLVGISLIEGGYRIVFSTSLFDMPGHVHTSLYEQRYDQNGQRVGEKTLIDPPTDDMASSRAGHADALGGGSIRYGSDFPDGQHPTLFVQHDGADGAAIDGPIQLGGVSIGWVRAMLALPDGKVVLSWQSVSHVGSGPLYTAVLNAQ